MTLISYHSYHKTIKKLSNNQLVYQRFEYKLELYKTGIITYSDSFPLHSVLDISFKPFTNGKGFMYLHTDRGLYSYHVSTEPKEFINEFKKLKSSNHY
ncbi:hypothetical protein JOC86_000384 [Bacillus pakistanensis]|uniref:Uncharacterized protein n=1 Tax=Rossellomorea pakistanensis TaxID=992288 RepID=A0ABS2N7L9_9BACI|nr:hypothetical protein [Bacillus pakistanensis]